MTLVQSSDWGKSPWDITGENLTRWRRYVWRERHRVYMEALSERQKIIQNDIDLKNMQNGY